MMHYAKGVAHSILGRLPRRSGRDGIPRGQGPRARDATRHNNKVVDLLAVADEMLTGELEYRRGDFDIAFAHLRRSVELDDTLPYDEPWGWMQPTRHALGALLLEQGRVTEAEAVYRSDLGYDGSSAERASIQRMSGACMVFMNA